MWSLRNIAIVAGVLICGAAFTGCGTVGALRQLASGIVGTANKAANKTVGTADKAVGKALTPRTYAEMPSKMRNQPRSYQEPSKAKRTSARNSGARNSVSNSSRKPNAHGNGAAYLRDAAKSSKKNRR